MWGLAALLGSQSDRVMMIYLSLTVELHCGAAEGEAVSGSNPSKTRHHDEDDEENLEAEEEAGEEEGSDNDSAEGV